MDKVELRGVAGQGRTRPKKGLVIFEEKDPFDLVRGDMPAFVNLTMLAGPLDRHRLRFFAGLDRIIHQHCGGLTRMEHPRHTILSLVPRIRAALARGVPELMAVLLKSLGREVIKGHTRVLLASCRR